MPRYHTTAHKPYTIYDIPYTIYRATQCSPYQSSGRARRMCREREAACDRQSSAEKKRRNVIETHGLWNTLPMSEG